MDRSLARRTAAAGGSLATARTRVQWAPSTGEARRSRSGSLGCISSDGPRNGSSAVGAARTCGADVAHGSWRRLLCSRHAPVRPSPGTSGPQQPMCCPLRTAGAPWNRHPAALLAPRRSELSTARYGRGASPRLRTRGSWCWRGLDRLPAGPLSGGTRLHLEHLLEWWALVGSPFRARCSGVSGATKRVGAREWS